MISKEIVICTKNFSKKTFETIDTISLNLNSDQSVILINQSLKNEFKKNIKIKIFWTPKENGLSRARNLAIKKSDSSILAWTDDDCITTKKYHSELSKIKTDFFLKNHYAAVFGKTLPYKEKSVKNKYCPCTFQKKSEKPIKNICKHWENIGSGNNMVIFKKTFEELGGFKPWLGAGSFGESGEDTEFILRCLIANYKIGYNPNMVIYHNKWLGNQESRLQNCKYKTGGIAAYGFYAFQGVKECNPIVKEELYKSLKNITEDLKITINNPREIFYRINTITNEFFYVIKGLIIAFLFAKIIPIPEKENVVKKFYSNA